MYQTLHNYVLTTHITVLTYFAAALSFLICILDHRASYKLSAKLGKILKFSKHIMWIGIHVTYVHNLSLALKT